MKTKMLCLSVALVLAGSAEVSAQQPPANACARPEYRQFDFWLGDWEVVGPAGRVVGHNSITKSMNGCVLHEHWTSAAGTTGESFNIYQRTTGKWHQSWVDSGGTLLLLDGGLENGAMVLRGETPTSGGGRQLHRITYTKLENGTVRQLWEVSADGGTQWTVSFDGLYRKTK